MVCKNCNKEMGNNAAFCPECGAKAESIETVQANKADITTPQSVISNNDGTTAVKKLSKGKIALIAVFAVLIIIVIACAFGGDESEGLTIDADNYNGMSFNYDISEWCDNFNEAISKVDEEFETETDIKLKSSSFKLDSTDYDTTDANVVRYYYTGNFKKDDDFAISLYVDSDTDKICKCEINYVQYSGDDLTLLLCYNIVPSIMATTNTDFDTARSILVDDVLNSTGYTHYNNNIFYQHVTTSGYDSVAIQAVSKEVYDEKY